MIPIYIDCDDTILNSSEVIIKILNEKYGTNKTIQDLKDYHFRSIVRNVTQEEILGIFDSSEFWKEVKIKEEFIVAAQKLKNNFNFIFVSKGTRKNLEQKEQYLKNFFNPLNIDFQFYGIPLEPFKIPKSIVNMSQGIQIDDVADELLGSNAPVRILIKNGREDYWNKIPVCEDNLYIVNTWEEIVQILEWAYDYPEFMANFKPELYV